MRFFNSTPRWLPSLTFILGIILLTPQKSLKICSINLKHHCIYATAFEPEITGVLDRVLSFLKNSANITNKTLSNLLSNSKTLYSTYMDYPLRNQTLQ